MRPFKRVKMLNADEYRVLKAAVARRKTPAGKARRARSFCSLTTGIPLARSSPNWTATRGPP